MNKKMLTLIAFLVALTSVFAVFVEIGDGTTTTNYVPFNGYYNYGWSTYILTSDQIGDAIDINELKFNVDNTPSDYTANSQQIYMKLTTDTEVVVAYPDPLNNGFTLVFDGSVTWNGSGWQGVILNSQFSYDGTSNLQIVWENNDTTWASEYPFFVTTASDVNIAAYNHFDASFPVVDGTILTAFPNMRLGYVAEGAPTYPIIVSPENNTLNNELDTDLVWTNGGNTEFIDVYLSSNEEDVVNNVESALVVDGELVTSFSPTLENATVYFWKVVASNSTSEITAETNVYSFSTTYGVAEVPYNENFEGVTPPALPLGWVSYHEGTSSSSYVDTYVGQAYQGSNSLRIANNNDIAGTYIVVLPQIENMGSRMKFYAKCSSTGAQVIIGYLVDVTDATTFTEIQTIDLTSDYMEHTVDLELPRTVRYLAFKHANVSTYNTIYLDNILVEEIPENEPTPATLLTPENDAIEVAMDTELTWEYGMNTVAVNLYLSDDKAEINDLATGTMVIDNQNVTSYTADLAIWKTYYWRVGSLNATGYEVLSDIYSFTTVRPEGTIQIGNSAEVNEGMPIDPYFGYSYSQTIYSQTDVNLAGDIQIIGWHYNGNSGWGPDDIKIYMAHTTLTSYETTESWVAVDDLTLVYEGTLSVPAIDGWTPITLDTPFNYNNTDNLIIAVEENTTGFHTSNDEFFNTVADGNVSIAYRNDSINPDPVAPPVGTLKAYYPNVVLVMDAGDPPVDEYPAPTSLTAEIENENDVHLAWNKPIFPDEGGEWLWHGSGIYDDGFGNGEALTYIGVARYDASDLENYAGANLTQMKFYPRNATATYTLKVWTGGSYDGTTFVPGTQMLSQVINEIETFAWNIVELDNAVTLTSSEELWIGIETVTPNGYPLGVDAGPAVVGKGDLIFYNGGWNLISNMSNNKNFLIQAFVEGGRFIERDVTDFTAYNIYRNNSIIQSIADFNDTTWVNTDIPDGTYQYKVTALYGTEASEPSNIAEVVIDTTPPVYNPPANFTAVIVDVNNVQINWDAPNARIRTSSRRELMFGLASDTEVTRDLTGYTLYRDNEILAEVGTEVMSYLDEELDYGTYAYKAIANYAATDSAPTPVVTIVIGEEEILPPTAVVATLDGDDAVVTWDAPNPNVGESVQEGFEEAFPPAGWSTVVTNTTYSWTQYETVVFQTGDVVPTEGMYQAGVMWAESAQDEWLITNSMNCPAGNLTFDFYGHYGSTHLDNYYVKVSTDGTNWTPIWNATDLPEADNHYDTPIAIDLSAYVGQNVQFAWNFVDGDGAGLWYATYIDNINIGGTRIRANELTAVSKAVRPSNEFTAVRKAVRSSNVTRITRNKKNPNEPAYMPMVGINSTRAFQNAQLVRGNLEPIVNPTTTATRELLGYKVWRFLATDQGNEANWTLLTTDMITDLTLTDTSWDALSSGSYKFAVKANYTNDNMSPAAFSNVLLKDMYGTVDGTVSTDGSPISGATVALDGNSATTDASGYFLFTDVLAGEYTISASANGYVSSTQTITVVGTQLTTVDFNLAVSNILISDSFETYTDFALEAAPWTMIDGDLNPTWGISNTTFENAGSPMAYIVFNPLMTTPALSENYYAHTGAKFMACFAAYADPVMANNDWLMTQTFTLGDSGSFSFWGKSISSQDPLDRFNVLVSDGSTNPNDFTSISGATYTQTTTDWTQYSYSLEAYANQTIRVAIQCVSENAFIFMVDDVTIDAPGGTDNDNNDIAVVSQLKGNYPNPFNPETTIAFSTKENGPVSIDIYNIKGQKVKALVSENMQAGPHTVVWNGTNDNGKSVSSGVFFYRMKSGKYSSTKKMILMK